MLKKAKNLILTLLILLVTYIVYFFIGAILIFLKDFKLTEEEKMNPIDLNVYFSEEIGPDQAVILEDGELALAARFNLIENAKESIKIANFKLESGEVSNILYALLIEKAREGIEVQLLFDGLTHNLYGLRNELYWALSTTPNIEIRFYEEFNYLRPWTFNNRLHDKIFMIDGKQVITGGRNIGDNYYLKDKDGRYAYDRDVLIHTESPEDEATVIKDFEDYFSELWDHEYTTYITKEELVELKEEGKEGQSQLLNELESRRAEEAVYLKSDINWEEISFETNHISFITNPIERMKKNPEILQIINALMVEAEEIVLMQSPYFIWNTELQNIIAFDKMEASIHLLTNSETSTNNFMGVAGFLNLKDETLPVLNQVYGFQGDGSIHAKSYVIDERLSLIGSFNMDPRSAFLSTENLVVIDSLALAEELSSNILSLMEESRIYKEDMPYLPEAIKETEVPSLSREWLIRIARVLIYPFDELL